MNSTDAEIIRDIRREFSRRPVDPTRLMIEAANGRVTLSGIVATLRDKPDVNLQEEIDIILKILTRYRLIKEVSASSVRLIKAHQKEQETATRGRTRH